MQVQSINNQNINTTFGNVPISGIIDRRLSCHASRPSFIKRYNEIIKVIESNGFDEVNNVGIILDIGEHGNFIGQIYSPKIGTPNLPNNTCIITKKHKDIKNFKNWLEWWDEKFESVSQTLPDKN